MFLINIFLYINYLKINLSIGKKIKQPIHCAIIKFGTAENPNCSKMYIGSAKTKVESCHLPKYITNVFKVLLFTVNINSIFNIFFEKSKFLFCTVCVHNVLSKFVCQVVYLILLVKLL